MLIYSIAFVAVFAVPEWVHGGYTHKDYMIRTKRQNKMFNSDYVNTYKDKTEPSDRNQE